MGALSRSLNVIGLVFLTHAVYSAYEHALLTTTSSSLLSSDQSLPLDITIEALVSLLILTTGIVLGAPSLRPIQWREWAASVQREDNLPPDERRKLVERKLKGLDGGGLAGSPFIELERRSGFLDIRAQRREHAEWVKNGGKAR